MDRTNITYAKKTKYVINKKCINKKIYIKIINHLINNL